MKVLTETRLQLLRKLSERPGYVAEYKFTTYQFLLSEGLIEERGPRNFQVTPDGNESLKFHRDRDIQRHAEKGASEQRIHQRVAANHAVTNYLSRFVSQPRSAA